MSAASEAESPSTAKERVASIRELLDRPLTSYYLVLGCSAMLLALGLMMVLSASAVESLRLTDSPFTWFVRQALSVAIGLPLMWLCSRMPPRFFRVIGYPLMALAFIGLIIVLFAGKTHLGAQRWIDVGPLYIQPSEPAKLGMALWGADLLARKEQLRMLTDWKHLLIPLMPGAAILGLLVMMGRDLGTTLVLMIVFLGLLWVVGAPLRLFTGLLGLAILAVAMAIMSEPYRKGRITAFLDPWSHASDEGYQTAQGLMAIGSGGWFGTGLGGSRGKWRWIPHAESDFIFSIIGEELGLIGTLVVISLFGLLGYAGLRIAARVDDTFMRLAAAAVTAWITGQAMVNIGAVIGVLPVTGIPLPLVSYGGSALLPTLAALGMLLSFAKREPGAQHALAARGPGPVLRGLSWLGLGGRKSERRPRPEMKVPR